MSGLNIRIKVKLPEIGLHIMADAQSFSAERTFTVKDTVVLCYKFIESAFAGFTAVVYGMFRRFSASGRSFRRVFRNRKTLPSGKRIAQLAYAGGGLRL